MCVCVLKTTVWLCLIHNVGYRKDKSERNVCLLPKIRGLSYENQQKVAQQESPTITETLVLRMVPHAETAFTASLPFTLLVVIISSQILSLTDLVVGLLWSVLGPCKPQHQGETHTKAIISFDTRPFT